MIDIFSGARPAGDILSRVVRVTLGGQTYELPVRSIKANREWKANLNARTAAFVGGLVEAGNDFVTIYSQIATQADDLLDMLIAYDSAGVLPSRDEIEAIEPDVSMELVAACQEVWRAASPLVVTALEAVTTATSSSSPPTSTPVPPTATARRRKSTTA